MSSEERGKEPAKECMHKTKVIQFLGRSTPVILQNDNGPCPLIAVCNVLLLRNNLNLNSDVDEVSQEKLLSLVAERLIDSNSNVNNKDVGYLENQQQNIADAIDLLPRLATGVDVNLRFRRIDDFEFTPECAIFDLLDIPLYHGWILDPQDYDTCSAVGSKSYNVIMSELVALEALSMDLGCKNNPEDDSVDFAAATTATLGVPSPCLSRSRSFDESLQSVSGNQKLGKGDVEEEAELLRILQLSEVKMPKATENPKPVDSNGQIISDSPNENTHNVYSALEQSVSTTDVHAGDDNKIPHYATSLNQCSVSLGDSKDLTPIETIPGEVSSSGTADQQNQVGKHDISISVGDLVEKGSIGISEQIDLKEDISTNAVVDETIVDSLVQNRSTPLSFTASDSTPVSEEQMDCFLDQSTSMADINEQIDPRSACNMSEFPSSSAPDANSGLSHDRSEHASETLTSNVDTNEPIYEGEDCVLNSRKAGYADREPVYEGEVVLAEQADKTTIDDGNTSSIDGITSKQGELIRNFLKNNANQLTVYGLFCLQDGLKERELCVFFRNNHFSTMFKLDGHLYLLATDQGYINQPDLVWEKLNEVNGDTVFMTSNFKEFKTDSHADNAWNEQNARANTADYLASVDSSAQASSNLNSDLQLAIALQQQEFEQQSQCHNSKQPSASGSSGLITGPQVPRNSGRSSSSASKPETKSKEKCIIM